MDAKLVKYTKGTDPKGVTHTQIYVRVDNKVYLVYRRSDDLSTENKIYYQGRNIKPKKENQLVIVDDGYTKSVMSFVNSIIDKLD